MPDRRQRILVLGGYGHFGARICRRLARDSSIELVVAGRDWQRAEAFVDALQRRIPAASLQASQIDIDAPDLKSMIASIAPAVVVHTAGPFQGQDYRVARACLGCAAHYVDLADGRDFVVGFSTLDDEARDENVLLVSGASTLPGVSSAVVDHLQPHFRRIDGIAMSIAPANQTPRGLGTVASVASYCGRGFDWLEDGRWRRVHGWQQLTTHRYPGLGRRLLGACDVPDLALFPRRYAVLETVTFHAGLELAWQQWGLWLMACARRARLIDDWSRHAAWLKRIGDRFGGRGSDRGAMHVHVRGEGLDGDALALTWYLTALAGTGPEIPCVPATVLARKLARGGFDARGARACLGLVTLDEFDAEVKNRPISWTIVDEKR
ncbi:MAG: saccharopine dehydrogenase NADP-binding domain-containing protein [Gammaproteobacteria bacterium]|nr:saccharopine dehydrogenase NADP-binding domain-containing protein [Gammaproteobacteria bacterium]